MPSELGPTLPKTFLEQEKPDETGGASLLPGTAPAGASGGVLSVESPLAEAIFAWFTVTGSENSPRGLVQISEVCDLSPVKRHFAVIIYVEEKY